MTQSVKEGVGVWTKSTAQGNRPALGQGLKTGSKEHNQNRCFHILPQGREDEAKEATTEWGGSLKGVGKHLTPKA